MHIYQPLHPGPINPKSKFSNDPLKNRLSVGVNKLKLDDFQVQEVTPERMLKALQQLDQSWWAQTQPTLEGKSPTDYLAQWPNSGDERNNAIKHLWKLLPSEPDPHGD